MTVFTKLAYAIEEAEYMCDQTGKAHSVINYGAGEFVVMETDRALVIFRQVCILETIKPIRRRGDFDDESDM